MIICHDDDLPEHVGEWRVYESDINCTPGVWFLWFPKFCEFQDHFGMDAKREIVQSVHFEG
jgi:hypothetical protein